MWFLDIEEKLYKDCRVFEIIFYYELWEMCFFIDFLIRIKIFVLFWE